MGRILAIDYGRKRCGIAVTDPLKIIAKGLTTVHSADLIDFLKKYFEAEEVECVVIGIPVQMNGQPSEANKYIEPFINRFKKVFPDRQLEYMDERFTSKIAHQTLIDSGVPKMKRQNKELVDTISAALILQTYMERFNNALARL